MNIHEKNRHLERRRRRVRKNVFGTSERPRLNVFRSRTHIYAQIIDDLRGHTLAAASTLDKDLRTALKSTGSVEAAKAVGKLLAERAKAAKVGAVVFDRGGRLYHGRVKALAEASRQGGCSFRIACCPEDSSSSSRKEKPSVRVNPDELSLKDKVVFINRVAKVVKGGKRFNFCALVVVGDGQGWVGIGKGKAAEVPVAISKAVEQAKKHLVRVPLKQGTIPHEVHGLFGGEHVLLKPAAEGTGIIAGGAVRAVVELVGAHNIIAKTLGRGNPFNTVRATLNGLTQLRDPQEVLHLRRAIGGEALAKVQVG